MKKGIIGENPPGAMPTPQEYQKRTMISPEPLVRGGGTEKKIIGGLSKWGWWFVRPGKTHFQSP